MPSGQALSSSMGPVPKRNTHDKRPRGLADQTALELLPAEGRDGPAPDWPLELPPTEAEASIWRQLWTQPQAVAWERLAMERVVARYARVLVEAECPGWHRETQGGDLVYVESRAITTARTAATNMEDRLGLSPLSMLRLRWGIEGGNRGPVDQAAEEVPDVRTRLKVMKEKR
jgi:hypothetical protein